ncbi:hypothetical protein L226DRAFT_562663 [Lentinus tigrinus ALCF2SS1-7]|uniref:uncharacterized protein n=1 Tax=Lentinus tigrinus ALCF2SS1-7 TaxID=1328758 RepID=UPI001166040C|nr:hypothetical protein L226DRAFT_562663 [Lentinus tigrinus ALCF2SS1-7]
MADAKARAEARRKAILARGGDRLARITTSARGEEGASYMHDAPSLPSRGLTDFVGETSDMPTPAHSSTPGTRNVSDAHTSPFSAAGLGSAAPDPSVWSEEQQQQFMNALLGAAASGQFPGTEQPRPRASSISSSSTAVAPSIAASSSTAVPPPDDPMAALMSALQQGGAGAPPGFQFPGAGAAAQSAAPKPKTLLQKLMPIVHVVCAWMLLAYFVLWKEPEAYEVNTHGGIAGSRWRRWADLAYKAPEDNFSVQTVPFFWAFTTLALVLHTWRIFTRLDPIQPPMLLSFALPHLPPPLPAVITNGLKYLQIGGVFLDDISALIVGLGFLIWVATWIAT